MPWVPLGVATLDYLPYTFLALFVPIISALYAVTGKFIWYNTEEEQAAIEAADQSLTEQ